MANNPNFIQQQWEGFRLAVGIAEASEVQQREMRRAFFAGALSLLRIQMGSIDHSTHPDEVTDGDIAVMEYISMELDHYSDDIKEGRA